MTLPKPTDPLTIEEVQKASKLFFELFNEVLKAAPPNTSVEDAIKLSESIFGYAHKLRAIDRQDQEDSAPFGFNKKTLSTEESNG